MSTSNLARPTASASQPAAYKPTYLRNPRPWGVSATLAWLAYIALVAILVGLNLTQGRMYALAIDVGMLMPLLVLVPPHSLASTMLGGLLLEVVSFAAAIYATVQLGTSAPLGEFALAIIVGSVCAVPIWSLVHVYRESRAQVRQAIQSARDVYP